MDIMKKRLISLSDPQNEYLDSEAKKLGISPAELMRRIIDWYRGESTPATQRDKIPCDTNNT